MEWVEGMHVTDNNPEEENRRLRQTMRDLVALSTLPAIWTGLSPEGIARSLADVLYNTLSVDLLYIRLPGLAGDDVIEVVRTKHGSDPTLVEKVKASLTSILTPEGGETTSTMPDPFGEGMLYTAITRFGIAGDVGVLITGSASDAFPSERDRLLLGVGANQTTIVVQRLKAEKQLREQGERLRTTLASIGDAVITTDTDRCCVNLNPIAESLTGWTNAEALGQPLDNVFHIVNENTRQPVENPATRALREGLIVGLANHTILIAKDGTERPIDDSAAPIRCNKGEIVGCVLVFRDVTEQRTLERENAKREEHARFLAAIITSSNDAIISKTLDGTIQSWNAAAERIFGYTAEQAIGRHISMLIPRERIEEEEYIIAQLRAGQRVEHFDTVRLGSDGQSIFVSLTISPIRNAQGDIIGASKIARDITERKVAEERLRELAARLQFVLKTAQIGEWDLNLVTGSARRSLTHDKCFGYDALLAEWSYEIFLSHVHPDEREWVNKRFQQAAKSQTDWDFECRVVWPDQTIHWIEGHGSHYQTAVANENSMLGTVKDITERKRQENQLRELAARLSEADRRKDEFLATLAHELRNPLAPIRTGLEVMKLSKDDPDTMEEIRGTMERQTQQLMMLVDDLLDVSRITKGKLELRKCRVKLADVVQSAVEASRPFIVESDHKMTVAISDEPIYVDADPHRLAQVLSNLLNNSIKYTPQGGHIQLSAERQGSDAVVSVEDNGFGIPAEMLERIFEMFAQIDRPQERGYTGLGIGLSLAKSLVEMHHGRIEVRSEGSGKGSEFSVRLPILPESHGEERDSNHSEDLPTKANDKRKVLVIDDNKAAATMLSMVVKMLGNEVREAHDGKEGIEVAEAFLPDVIFMDIGMPKMNGYEAARHIRQQPWSKKMMLVALTGWGQEKDKQRTKEAGFDHHLVKPAEPAAIQKLLSSPAGDATEQAPQAEE